MATQQTARGEVTASCGAVLGQRVNRVIRAAWRESALRTEIRAKCSLVSAHKKQQGARGNGHFHRFVHWCGQGDGPTAPKRRETSSNKSVSAVRNSRCATLREPVCAGVLR